MPLKPFMIRPERIQDHSAIRRVNERAFAQSGEAELVDDLHKACDSLIALVACDGEDVIGHILFSPLQIIADDSIVNALGLAPLAVLPEYHGQGVGSLLVRSGLDTCRAAGHSIVVVLGHAAYYPRFGFKAASQYGIRWEQDAPDEAFMITELQAHALHGVHGIVKFHPAFDRFS